jgi:hypothetical protein
MMKRLIVALIMAGALVAVLSARETETCFKSGEKESGLNKICYYNCPSGEAAITIKGYQLCPLNIKR